MVAVITAPGLGLERNSGSLLGANGQLGTASLGAAKNNVYVNAATGNLVVQAVDQFLIGQGPDVDLARTYNSLGFQYAPNGAGWSDRYNNAAYFVTGYANVAGATIARITGDGATVTYTYNSASNNFIGNEGGGAYDTISFDPNSATLTWRDGSSQTAEIYDMTNGGRLVSVMSLSGSLTVSRNPYNGNITSVSAQANAIPAGGYQGNYGGSVYWGNTVNLNYQFTNYGYTLTGATSSALINDNNYASGTVTPYITNYYYDDSGRLTSVQTQLTPLNNQWQPSVIYYTAYGYVAGTNLLNYIGQSDGSQITVNYDNSNRVQSVLQTLDTGATTSMTFSYSSGSTTVTDNANNSSTFGYDSFGELTSITTPLGETESATYNAMGSVTSITQNGVLRHTYTYDSQGNQISDVDAVGDLTLRTFSPTDQLLTSTQYTGKGATGTPLTTTYVYNAPANAGYSPQGSLAYVITPNQEVTKYLYQGAQGEATSTIKYAATALPSLTLSALDAWSNSGFDQSGAVRTDYAWSTNGAIKSITRYTSTSSAGVGQGPAVQTLTYTDFAGVLRGSRNAGLDTSGNQTLYQFWANSADSLGRTTTETLPNGQAIDYTYSRATNDMVVTANDSTNGGDANHGVGGSYYPGVPAAATTSTYNQAGELVSTTVVAPNAPTATTTYAYNSLGQLRSVSDPTGVFTYYVYDADGRKVADVLGDGSITTYAYNADGLLAQTVVHDNKLSSAQLNLLQTSGYSAPVSLAWITPPAGPAGLTGSDLASYAFYDADGRQIETIDPAGTITTYTYDYASRLTSETTYASQISSATAASYLTNPLPTPTTTAGQDRTTTFTYDNDGQLTQTVVNSGGLNLTTKTTYDAFGNIVAITDPNLNITRFIYNQAAQLIYKIDGNGDVTFNTYDTDNNLLTARIYGTALTSAQLAALTPTLLATTSPQSLMATITGEVQTADETTPNSSLPTDRIQTNSTYDSYGRLSTSLIYGTETYSQAGDLVINTDRDVMVGNTSGAVTRFIYDGNNRPIYTINGAGAVTKTVYDAAGRVLQTIAYANPLTSGQLAALTPQALSIFHMATVVAGDISPSSKDQVNSNVYDTNGRLAFTIDAVGHATEYDYDAEGRVVQTTLFGAPIATTSTYFLAYVQGQVASQAGNSSNRVTRSIYNAAGQLAYSIDPVGRVSAFTYDAFGNAVRDYQFVTAFTASNIQTLAGMQSWAASNVTTTSTVANDRLSLSVYDGANRRIFSVDAAGDVSQTVYDTDGHVVASLDYATALTSTQITNLMTAPITAASITAVLTPSTANDHVNRAVYDGAGRLIYSIDATGAVTQKVYDGDGKVVATIAYANRLGSSTFANLPMQISATTIASDVAAIANSTVDQTTRYVYGSGGRLRFVIDSTGAMTAMNWDNDSRLVSTITYATRLNLGSIPLEANAYSLIAMLGQDYLLPLTAQSANDEVTSYTYDTAGRQLTKTDAQGRTTTNQYDTFGNLVKVTDPLGASGYFYYNNLNQQIRQVDADGYVTDTAYSIGGQVISVTRYANVTSGATVGSPPTVIMSSADETTTIGRDNLDRIVSNTDAMGYQQTFGLDVFGDQLTVTKQIDLARPGVSAARFATTYNSYDSRGLLTSTSLPETSTRADGMVEASNVTNTYSYDAFGNRTQMVEAAGLTEHRTTAYAYDAMNRLASITGDTLASTYSVSVGWGSSSWVPTLINVTPTQTTTYDAFGNVIQSVDANGDKTFTYYDTLNRKVAEVNPVGALSTWVYDAFSNATAARVYGDLVAMPASNTGTPPSAVNPNNYRQTNYSYNLDNEQTGTSIGTIVGGALVGGVLVGSYSGGSYISSIQAITTQTTYDADGRVKTQVDGNHNTTTFNYDADGRLTSQIDGAGAVTAFIYNSDGNVLHEVQYAAANSSPTATPGANDRVTDFTYDLVGHRTSEIRRGVLSVASTITGSGAPTQTLNDATISYTYNGLGEVLSKTEATGDRTDYVYDAVGRQTDVLGPTYFDYTSAAIRQHTVNYYDGLNNLTRTEVGSVVAGTGVRISPANDHVTQNSYGTGGRLLLSVDAAGNDTNYYYDANGVLVNTVTFRKTSTGRQLKDRTFSLTDAAGRLSLTYRLERDMTTLVYTLGDLDTNVYDAYGELTSQTVNGVTQASYTYDGAGHLSSSTANGGVQQFFVNDANGNVTLEIDDTGQGLGGATVGSVLASYTTNGIVNGGVVSKLTTTITTYNGHNQALSVIQPERQLNGSGAATLTDTKTYDAFGDVLSDTNATGALTTFSYNTLGNVVQEVEPAVYIGYADGTTSSTPVSPILNYAYDLSGRMVGTEDANGFWTTRTLLAGTGYNGSDPTALTVFSPDGNHTTVGVDAFGNERRYTNQLGVVEARDYDAMNRLTMVTQDFLNPGAPDQLITNYRYDQLGQRINQWNSALVDPTTGLNLVQTTDYDLQGRVVSQVDYMGHATTYSYTMNTLGGWDTTQVNSTGLSETTSQDIYGRTVHMTDFADVGGDPNGGNIYDYTYDAGGRLVTQTTKSPAGALQATLTNTYYNTGRTASTTDSFTSLNFTSTVSNFTYDAQGNRLTETTANTATPAVFSENVVATFDALNRLATYSDTRTDPSGVTVPRITDMTMSYDAVGNVRNTLTHYVDQSGASQTQDYWFRYDSMNRFNITQGTLSGGLISAGTTGTELTYDQAGQRLTAITYTGNTSHTETYSYTNTGYLTEVQIQNSGQNQRRAAVETRDAMGRVTKYEKYGPLDNLISTSTMTYNAENLVTQQVDVGASTTTTTNYSYTQSGVWEGGQVVQSDSWSGSSTGPHTITVNQFTWAQSVNQSRIDVTTSGATGTTTFTYDPNGHLTKAEITGANARTVNYATAANGQVLSRIETSTASTNPAEFYFYLNGVQLGHIGNNGTGLINYTQVIANQSLAGTPYAAFGDTYVPINPTSPGSDGTNVNGGPAASYTVQSGDTLQSIASALWGDGSLWYLIADANGLSGSSTLTAGTTLSVPNQVVNLHNSASTFTVYDPSKAIGNVQPSAPPPPAQHGGCGAFGQILVAIVAVAVTALIAGPISTAVSHFLGAPLAAELSGATGSIAAASEAGDYIAAAQLTATLSTINTATGVIAGAAGSLAGQAFGVATGIQSQINWSGVALAALSGGINGGLSTATFSANPILNAAARGVVGSAATQGIGVATGLQSKFDWASVATAGVSAAVGAQFGGSGPISGIAGDIAGAAARSLITGTDFGQNLRTALPDIIGQTVGGLIVAGINAAQNPSQTSSPTVDTSPQTSDSGSVVDLAARLNKYGALPSIFGTTSVQISDLAALSAPVGGGDGYGPTDSEEYFNANVNNCFIFDGPQMSPSGVGTPHSEVDRANGNTVYWASGGKYHSIGFDTFGDSSISLTAGPLGVTGKNNSGGYYFQSYGNLEDFKDNVRTYDTLPAGITLNFNPQVSVAPGDAPTPSFADQQASFHDYVNGLALENSYLAIPALLPALLPVATLAAPEAVGIAVEAGSQAIVFGLSRIGLGLGLLNGVNNAFSGAEGAPGPVAAETAPALQTLGPGWRVLAPAGEGAATGTLPNGYQTVSRWVSPQEASAWMAEGGTGIPTVSGSSGRMYVTELGAARPGGTGPIRVDFAVPQGALQPAGKSGWFQIFQPTPSRPIYNVQVHVPQGVKVPGY